MTAISLLVALRADRSVWEHAGGVRVGLSFALPRNKIKGTLARAPDRT